MNGNIEIIPALKRLELKHVGFWKSLRMEFIPGLNIITEEDGGSGKSTILRAIVQSIHPSARMKYSLSPTVGYSEGAIVVELMSTNVTLRMSESPRVPSPPTSNESRENFMLRLLRFYIETAPPGAAILIEDEVTAVLDDQDYAEVVKLLSVPRCQVICIITGHRLDLNQFRRARIYACFGNQIDDKAQIRLMQSGGADN